MSRVQKEIAAAFHEHVRRLSKKDKNRDGFDDEVDELRRIDQQVSSNVDEFYTASLASSMSKNRFPEVKANEGTLVRLGPLTGNDQETYINANYVDGREHFGVPFTYIATQAPLSNTIFDFWRMVYESDASFIVMLCAEVEDGKRKSEMYWPREGEEMDFGVLRIRSVKETRSFELTTRYLVIRTVRGEERNVIHIQYCSWPDQGIPDSSASLMEIIQTLGKLERSVRNPIIVHCSGGIGRTGVFIALHVILAQFQQERKGLDILSTVHTLKLCRSGMVQRKDQYVFLYYAAQREMDRMILSAEKGVDLLELRHRQRSRSFIPGVNRPFLLQSAPSTTRPLDVLPQERYAPWQSQQNSRSGPDRHNNHSVAAQNGYNAPLESFQPHQQHQEAHQILNHHHHQYNQQHLYSHRNQYPQPQPPQPTRYNSATGNSEEQMLEEYLRQTSSLNRSVVSSLPSRGGANGGPTRMGGTAPVAESNRNATALKDENAAMRSTSKDDATLEEELRHWQNRNKQMRSSTGSRDRGEAQQNTQELRSQPQQQQQQKQKQVERPKRSNDFAGEGESLKNAPTRSESGSGPRAESQRAVPKRSPTESLATGKEISRRSEATGRASSVASLASAVNPVSIIVSPQETGPRQHAAAAERSVMTANDDTENDVTENDGTGRDAATYFSHRGEQQRSAVVSAASSSTTGRNSTKSNTAAMLMQRQQEPAATTTNTKDERENPSRRQPEARRITAEEFDRL